MVWLHGRLELHIKEGIHLPGEQIGMCRNSLGRMIEGCIAKANPADCYAVLNIVTKHQVSKSRFRTSVISSHNPTWDERGIVDVAEDVDKLELVIKDSDVVGSDFVGRVEVPVDKILDGKVFTDTCVLVDEKGNPIHKKSKAKLSFAVQYISIDTERQLYDQGITKSGSVPNTFFPMRKGNAVRLYNDAHHPLAGPNASIPLASGVYEEKSCWDDLYKDLQAAEVFVYVAGWSVVDHTTLVRDHANPEQPGPTIGELLKEKADKHKLKVCLLVWDDQTSNAFASGVMGTKDEETKAFFKGSTVECVLVARGAKKESFLRHAASTTMFTHHQKLVVMDAPPAPGDQQRRVIAYVGGLDLTTGRYDTPSHPLFSTLRTAHSKDYYQGCLPGADISKGGPRQPWHDIHSRLEGPIAWDVLENFHQRWEKQAGLHRRHKILNLQHTKQLLVPNQGGTSNRTGDPRVYVTPPDAAASWNVQLFRSIDSDSVVGFPEGNREAFQVDLVTGKGTTVERSIHKAYVYAIRRAQHFLYIENQYFLGSSQSWPSGAHPAGGCDHLVCVEIALKCVEKIKAGQAFCAYILIPPFPEGNPCDASVQEILYWQAQTMRMMYGLIAGALKEAGSAALPTDYLQFFFVGQREPMAAGEEPPKTPPAADSPHALAQASRRHMIYVHSKMMITDDEYIIIGSANINMRSLSGSRDSEIAIGAYQPAFTMQASGGKLPLGDVHGFRLSLWLEHTGVVEDVYNDPASAQCARRVAAIAQANFDAFVQDEVCALPSGHLCRYPLQVNADGTVDNIPGMVNFVDTNASILGKNGTLPDALTT